MGAVSDRQCLQPLVLLFVAAGIVASSSGWATEVGETIPDIAFADRDGETHKISKFRGKWVFMDVWASFCAPCMQEIPKIHEAYLKHKNDKFEVVGVGIDQYEAQWVAGLERLKVSYPQFYSFGGFTGGVAKTLGIKAIPSTWILDPDGVIFMRDVRGEAALSAIALLAAGDREGLLALQSENTAWNAAMAAYTRSRMGGQEIDEAVTLLTGYLEAFPNGLYAEQAESLLLSHKRNPNGKVLKPTALGEEAAVFEYLDVEGLAHDLIEHRKKWLLLSLEAENQESEPGLFEKSIQGYEDKELQAVRLYLVRDVKKWEETAGKIESRAAIGRLEDRPYARIRTQYEPKAFPSYYLIDPEGNLAARDFSIDEIERYLKVFLRGTDEERRKLQVEVEKKKDLQKDYQKVIEDFGLWQSGQMTNEEFTAKAKQFIEAYPSSEEAELLEAIAP